jgi:hypothetical protein
MVGCGSKNGHPKRTCIEKRLDYVLKLSITILDATINIPAGWGGGKRIDDHTMIFENLHFDGE